MRKRVFSLLLAALLTLALLPTTAVTARADTVSSGECGKNLSWTLDDQGVLTITGTGAMYDYTGQYTEGRAPWRDDVGKIARIILPDDLTYIGNYAFDWCYCAESVTIPAGVTAIGENAFTYCYHMDTLTIPDKVASIGDYAFNGCSGLTSLTIPKNVKTIGDSAFGGCYELTDLTLAEGVESIGNNAFSSCRALTGVTIPASVKTLGTSVFSGCESMAEIRVAAGNPNYVTDGKALFNKSMTELLAFCNGTLETYAIPAGVTAIADGAFFDHKLTSVTIPDGVKTIGDSAFSNCGELTEVVLPDSVISIGKECFFSCALLTDVTLGSGLTTIGDAAFSYCWKLTTITIPAGVTSIGTGVFGQCGSMTGIQVAADNPNYSSDGKALFDKNKTELLAFCDRTCEAYAIPSGVTAIGDYAFGYCYPLKKLTIPASVTSIGAGAFYYCGNLKDLKLPAGITDIPSLAFYYCYALSALTIPEGVTSIGAGAFWCCYGLSDITIPASVTSIGGGAFTQCMKLATVTFRGSAPSFGEDFFEEIHMPVFDGVGFSAENGATAYYPADDDTWTEEVRQDYGGHITWVPMAALTITAQPKDQTVTEGETVKFTVEATGDGLTYQWQYKVPGGTGWDNSGMTGAKTATLSVKATAARNGQQYRCVIKDQHGSKVISDAAKLAVPSAAPVITAQPKSQSGKVGDTVKFTVKATGDGLTYQWQYKVPGSTGWDNSGMTGAKTATLSVKATAARNGQQYRCKITDANGNVAYSDAAWLTVPSAGPVITAQPQDRSAKVGDTVKFTVEATGDGLTYQWQYKVPGGTGWDNSGMTGAKTATLSVKATAARNGQQYRCKITDKNGTVVISDAAKLTVLSGPVITTQPQDRSAKVGDTVKFAVEATGDGLTYQWQYKVPGGTGWDNSGMTGAKTATLSVKATAARNGQQYRCKITDANGNVTYSDAAKLTVNN